MINMLKFDIQIQQTIHKNHKLFIKHRQIKLHKFKKKIYLLNENDLPIQAYLGSVFLIKGNNIIECYSWCDNNFSLYLQINKKIPIWIGKFIIINIENEDLENIKFLLDGNEIIYAPSEYQQLIIHFIQSGFRLYTK